MIEWIFSAVAQLVAWLWNSAMTLYYVAGFFVVLGGFVMFIGSVIHHYWSRTRQRRTVAAAAEPRVTVHVENLNVTLEMTEPELRRLLAERDRPALPSGDRDAEEEQE